MDDLKSLIKHVRLVDRMFEENKKYAGQGCHSPILGIGYLVGTDRTDKMMELAVRALLARDWFAEHGPSDAPPLPLSYNDRADMKYNPGEPLRHLVSCYANSLSGSWDFNAHPSFEDYARGVLASEYAPEYLTKNKEICERYPPRPLDGIGPGLCWEPNVTYKKKSWLH